MMNIRKSLLIAMAGGPLAVQACSTSGTASVSGKAFGVEARVEGA